MDSKIAVVVVLFNRVDLVKGLFERVKLYSPERIYIIADGPRANKEGEALLCAATRETALREITWSSEVIKLFSDTNLGCRKRIVSGLDAVFDKEEKAIILEDDTYPSEDFFKFCAENLNKYEDCNDIYSITGTRLFPSFVTLNRPCLSKFTHIWGWATWRRSWALYDRDMTCMDDNKIKKTLNSKFRFSSPVSFWMKIFEKVKHNKIDTWDYQLQASAWARNAKCLTPSYNMISNFGFRPDATHTITTSAFARLAVGKRKKNCDAKLGSAAFYDFLFQYIFHNPSLPVRVLLRCFAK